MSTHIDDQDMASSRECPVVDGRPEFQRIEPRTADVGGIPVNRVLPSRQRRLVGAWCFLDHAGPAVFRGNSRGLQVGPHPHTGLQTFTWMIEGEVEHRDSLGNRQVIRPGQVNLMTAGHGISHTETTVEGERDLHAVQLWIALPHAHRHTDPRFDHYPQLPQWNSQGIELTLLAGEFDGQRAPTLTFSELVGLDLRSADGGERALALRPDFEYALLPLEGDLEVDGESVPVNELAYLGMGRDSVQVRLSAAGRVVLVGGEPLSEEVLIWWNFVGHSREEISQAQRDWEAGSERFGEIPDFDGERLVPPPLPWKS